MWYSCGCSCSCGDDPCGCQNIVCPECTTTTSTTTIPCDGEKCDELYDCACIIYNGPDLVCYGIYNGDNLCKILQIAASNLPSCTITPPPTTTTTTCPCLGYEIVSNKGAAVSYSYTPCGEEKEIIDYLKTSPIKTVCAKRGSIPIIIAGSGSVYPTDPICCTPTTTIPSLKQRCTASTDYYAIEHRWLDFPDTFKLVSMKLDGIEYVNASTPLLTLNSAVDLNIGTGLDGNTYVMNISDWLTSIAQGSGFVFYDNMRVIDYPYAGATLYIEIEMTDPGMRNTYYYNDTNGFSYNGGLWNSYTCSTLP